MTRTKKEHCTPLDSEALERHPLPPVIDGDKKSKGEILIIAGSRDVPGAAWLAAMAAMRSGAGKLSIATAESASSALGIAMPEAMVIPLKEADEGAFANHAIETIETLVSKNFDAIVAGPGMKSSSSSKRLADVLLRSEIALALDVALLHSLEPPGKSGPDRVLAPVLLPNCDELSSLLNCDPSIVEKDPIGSGLRAARLYRAILLVKGVESHIVTPQADCWTYSGGAPGLGVSGSGDVLSGIVGGLLARGADPLHALLWGVWIHGEAGRRLSKTIGPIGFLAREILDQIPALLPH